MVLKKPYLLGRVLSFDAKLFEPEKRQSHDKENSCQLP